ncbi:unnamed protein product [Calicophoron daubneyi]|uniref:Uncharacterized protein n=1 Tax=Calicophoron daubneyi TaxID=300641 RepID=A0AAV2T3R6_CALDB
MGNIPPNDKAADLSLEIHKILKQKKEDYYGLVLYSDMGFIHWLVLFHDLFLFRNWSRPLSRYEVIPLWHSLDPKYGNSGPESVKNHLYIALLRMQDYRLFPIKPAEGGKFTLYWDFDHKSRGIEVLSVAIYNLLRKSK